MRRITIALILIALITFSFLKAQSVGINELKVKAPFDMPTVKVPDFSKCTTLSIADFGAIKDNKEKTSQAIAAAINKANKIGGGIVEIPEGEWLTKKIHLKSNVNLHLNKGAVLLFSEDPADYLPPVNTTWEGMECYNYSPLIYAYKMQKYCHHR